MKAKRAGPKKARASHSNGSLWLACAAGLCLAIALVVYRNAAPGLEPGPWLARLGPDAPRDVAVMRGRVLAYETLPPLTTPWGGQNVVAYALEVDQQSLVTGEGPGAKARFGPRLARLAVDEQSQPFKLQTRDGVVAVNNPLFIELVDEPASEACVVDELMSSLPGWVLAIPDARPPVATEGHSALRLTGRCVPVGEEVTVVGRRSAGTMRLDPLPRILGVLVYPGMPSQLESYQRQAPSLLSSLFPLLLAASMALGAIAAWLRYRSHA